MNPVKTTRLGKNTRSVFEREAVRMGASSNLGWILNEKRLL
jgi:hypothetical protein